MPVNKNRNYKPKKRSYTYNAKQCPIKEQNFQQILIYASAFIPKTSRSFLLFDNARLDNTKFISNYFPSVQNHQISVIEQDKIAYRQQQKVLEKAKTSLRQHLNDSFNQVLDAALDANIIYLDGTCSPWGNYTKGIHPIEDLWRLLKNSEVDKITIGLTYCIGRCPIEFEKERLNLTVYDLVERQVIPSAQWEIARKYAPRKKYRKTGGNVDMMFMVYNLRRNLDIDPRNVNHYIRYISNKDSTITKRYLGFSKEFDEIIYT